MAHNIGNVKSLNENNRETMNKSMKCIIEKLYTNKFFNSHVRLGVNFDRFVLSIYTIYDLWTYKYRYFISNAKIK